MKPNNYTKIMLFAVAWLWPLLVIASSNTTPLLTVYSEEMPNPVTLDRKALLSLPQVSMEEQLHWHGKPVNIEGPLISSLMEHLDISGDNLVITGLDGYKTEISMTKAYEMEAILILNFGGSPINTRELGPLILLFPQHSEISQQQKMALTVWQVVSIGIK